MISVPDAGTLPRIPRPIAASNGSIDLGREPVGVQRERLVEPDPHHLPVPGRRVLAGRLARWPGRAPVPASARGATPSIAVRCPSPSASRFGTCKPPTARDVLPSVSAPSSPYAAASGASPTPHESQTTSSTRGTNASLTPSSLLLAVDAEQRPRDAPPDDPASIGLPHRSHVPYVPSSISLERALHVREVRPERLARRRSAGSAPACCASGRRSPRRRRTTPHRYPGRLPVPRSRWRTTARCATNASRMRSMNPSSAIRLIPSWSPGDARAGATCSTPHGGGPWSPTCRSAWSPRSRGPAAPAPPGRRRRPPAGGWRRNGAACGA